MCPHMPCRILGWFFFYVPFIASARRNQAQKMWPSLTTTTAPPAWTCPSTLSSSRAATPTASCVSKANFYSGMEMPPKTKRWNVASAKQSCWKRSWRNQNSWREQSPTLVTLAAATCVGFTKMGPTGGSTTRSRFCSCVLSSKLMQVKLGILQEQLCIGRSPRG